MRRSFTSHRNPKALRGFTFIEFLLTVGIVLALASLASPFSGRFLLQDAVAETADRLALSLRNAQGFSLSGKDSSRWGVMIDGNSIVLFRGPSFAGRDISADRRIAIPQNVIVSGFSETVFDPVSGAPTTPLSISVGAVGATSRTVVLNSFGAVSRQ